ncbi:MAG: DUF5301 domain-containing protein [Lachnospiraceae bacterium]|nr:DUF5301 domain-containing protein [Lachnospiraceae bacterium]
MKKRKLILAVIMITFLFAACGKTQKMPVLLPDRADIISIGVTDGEKSAVSPNTEKEATEFIDAFYAILVDMETTNKESVTDAPTNKDYIMINLNCDDKGTTLFYYKENGIEYVEQPYQGIYKPKTSLEEKISELFDLADENLPAIITFQAIVLEASDLSVLVTPVEDSAELVSSDQFSIPNKEEIELQEGDIIEIEYDGSIMESYPAQLGEVYRITLIEQAEAKTMWDRIPMVKINDKLYYDTGRESTAEGRCGNMDGQITSTVDGSEIPTENNQSNFGSGFGYQYGMDDTIEIYMNDKWCVFEYREEK